MVGSEYSVELNGIRWNKDLSSTVTNISTDDHYNVQEDRWWNKISK